MRNVNFLFKKDFKKVRLLTKKSFKLYFRAYPKHGEGEKQKRHTKFMRKTNKKMAKADV